MTAPVLKVVQANEILARPFKNANHGLSPRQIEVLGWALEGKPAALIAAEMNVPEGTVRAHLFRALGKLGISKSELGWWVLKRLREVLND
ncbi:hypothetical protein LCGC14_2016900 [marine sediment metagenome]|uniref:HTH luxR-type domain-containing protein n=1 Tax=marine sediment metagenome TaxID=412755 RepID=A0A0F9FL57_9ZZZZ